MLDRSKAWLASWRETSLSPFSIPLFRTLWIAALASHIGAVVQSVSASWTMTVLAPSPQMVALVPAAAMLPMVILALPAGALADIMERRRLMLASQVLGASAAALLSVLAFTRQVTPWSLLALTAVVGAAVALHQPAWQAALGDFIPRKDLPAAVSLNVLAFNTARSVGPAMGGAIIATLGASAAFLLNAVSFGGLIMVLATHALPRAEHRHPPEPMLSAMAAGLRFVSLSPQMKRIFLRGGLFGLGASALQSLLPLMARTQLGGGPVAFGTLVGALGFGSFFGAIVAAQFRSTIGGNRLLGLATVVYAISTAVIALSTRLLLSISLAFMAGVAFIFVLTTTRTSVQLCCPRWVVGRAVSLGQVASFGCMALGSAAWGAVAGIVGLNHALLIAAFFLFVTTLLHYVAPLPIVIAEETATHPQREVRPPQMVIDHDEGPVLVVIEYSVPPEASAGFLALMNELGRARRRNGAIHWSLQRDIDRPDVWLEHIESSTWLDHVRRLDRYTTKERELVARAAELRTISDRAVRRTIAVQLTRSTALDRSCSVSTR